MDGYRALLIGNSTFPADPQNLQDLNGPVKDVALLGAALIDRDTGLFDNDHVALLAERPAGKILEEIEAFFFDARRDDLILLYYSGHGLLDERNRLYLAAANTRVDRLRSTAVSAGDVSEMLDNSAARMAVIMLDCCHSGAFKGSIGPANLAGSGRFVLTSCRSGELANDADRRNGTSLFTQHLVDGLMGGVPDLDGDGRIDVDEVYRYVHERLAESNRQIPQRRFDGSARTPALARRPLPAAVVPPRSPVPPAPPPPPSAADVAATGSEVVSDPAAEREAPPAAAPVPVSADHMASSTPSGPSGPIASRAPGRGPAVSSWLRGDGRRRLVLASAVLASLLVAAVLSVVMRSGESPPEPPRPPPERTSPPATRPTGPAGLSNPQGIALDSSGNLYIADSGNNRVVRVAPDRSSTTVAGSKEPRAVVDGLPATNTTITAPGALAALPGGGFVLVDQDQHLLSVSPGGILTTVRTGDLLGPSPTKITAVVAAPDGRLYVATEEKVFLVDPVPRNVGLAAGTDNEGFSGDGDMASRAQLRVPRALALDPAAKYLYIGDCENDRIRRVDLASNQIVTVAGGGTAYEEGGRAVEVGGLSCPHGLAVGPGGAVYFLSNGHIRKVADQRVTTVAGPLADSNTAVTVDGRRALDTTFGEMRGIAVDDQNRLYLSEGNRVRRIESDGNVFAANPGLQKRVSVTTYA